MMTEDEAKTKWCPFARVASVAADGGAVSANRMTRLDDECSCIGSACMAWRRELRLFHIERNHFIRENEGYSSTDKTEMLPTGHGYCGLAGRAE